MASRSPGKGLALLDGNSTYQGDYAHEWVHSQLAALDIHTSRDLEDQRQRLPPERRYKLVVTASDLTLGRLVRLPWDYKCVYGLDTDDMTVADFDRQAMLLAAERPAVRPENRQPPRKLPSREL
jgi:NTE family protein